MPRIEFWIEYASTYSYLSVARIGRLADARGVAIDWQPFWLYPVREAQGLPAPFPEGSARASYMWRDLERRAAQLQLPYRRPAVYPFRSVAIARIALVAAREGWCRQFTEAAFRLHWTEGVAMTEPENTAAALEAAGQDGARVQALAASEEVKEALKHQATRAAQRGIFGAPSFIAGDELFWGDDRLEAALDHAAARG
ncbi:MAG: 2-hydroxychromene-2-carboxylate isomerase [Ramlibacter sp.]